LVICVIRIGADDSPGSPLPLSLNRRAGTLYRDLPAHRFCGMPQSPFSAIHLVGAGEQHRRESDTESFLGMLFIASARYWIKFVRTAKNKTKPHAITINTNQIAIFPNLGHMSVRFMSHLFF
jgi:hypothetical protein